MISLPKSFDKLFDPKIDNLVDLIDVLLSEIPSEFVLQQKTPHNADLYYAIYNWQQNNIYHSFAFTIEWNKKKIYFESSWALRLYITIEQDTDLLSIVNAMEQYINNK